MEISLNGRRALVGGASRGLGKAIAMQLAKSGATVTIVARNEEKLRSVIKELPAPAAQQHDYLVIDFADFESLKSVIRGYFKSNKVDILVNNTNGPAAGGVLEKSVEDYQHAFDLLFKSVCFITMEALPSMLDSNYGRIINLSSVSVKEPIQNLVLSNSIRSAVLAWAKTLARDVAHAGITVNNVLTGYFDTERLEEISRSQAEGNGITMEDHLNNLKKAIPAGRLGDPVEFAYLVTFLASANSAYITGTNIPIDGGLLRST